MDAHRRFDVVAVCGFLLWLVLLTLTTFSTITLPVPATATLGVGLAMLVLVPLVARLADLPFRSGKRSRWYRTASFCALPSAIAAIVALSLPAGFLATLLAVPWFAVTGVLAVFGLQRGLPNIDRPPELAISVAVLYLPVAGVALLAHRAGVTFGFSATTMLLTVVHFHYAGCTLPAFVGTLGREHGTSRTYRALLVPVLFGPAIIGIGITLSPLVEFGAATSFGSVVAGVAVYTLLVVPLRDDIGYLFVAAGAVSISISMGVVVAYLVTRSTSMTIVGFETMLRGHGWLNAVGFGFVGLVGWRLVNPQSVAPPLGMPISRLVSRGRVGADYLERHDLVADGDATGMIDDFTAFEHPDFKPDRIAPAVRAFYERTAAYDLRIEATWRRGFKSAATLYARLSRRIEQMNFPVDDCDPESLSSTIVPVDSSADGRDDVRAWVRTYDETGDAIYVALYATHRFDERPYMNIAFPFPLLNVTSVLSVEPLGMSDPDGVVLSTAGDGDAGIYVRTPLGPLRLPMNETIRVWEPGMVDAVPLDFKDFSADLGARHTVTLLGQQFLRLDYWLADHRIAQ